MQSFIYDIDRKVFRNTSGLVRTSFKPSISYGERSTWEIQIQATDAGVVSLSEVAAWRAAVDQDFSSSTEPMARTLSSGITVDATGEWPVARVDIDTLTERFLAVCDGRQSTPVYFELAGLDGKGDTVFYLCFAIDALFPIDPVAAGTLAPVEVTTLTEAQVQAIASAAGEAAAKDAATSAASEVAADLSAHTSDSAIHVPASGTAGQVLTKTATGAEWKDAPASSGSSSGSSDSGDSGSTDLSDYYTKAETSALVSSETTARSAADAALDTRISALEQGSSGGTIAVSGGVVPVAELPTASAANLGTVYLLTTTGHVYQVKSVGSGDALGVRLSGDGIAFAGDYLPTGETTSVTYQDMTTLETVTKSFPVYSDGTHYLFAALNSYALAPLYSIGSSTTATPGWYAPSVDLTALSGTWYDTTYKNAATVTAVQYYAEDITDDDGVAAATTAQSAIDSHTADSSIHVPASGTAGQVLTKTDTGAEWKNTSASSSDSSIEEFSTTYREWTEADVGKLFRYTGETSGMFFKGRLYQGIHWKTSNAQIDDFDYDNVESTNSSSSSGTGDDSGSAASAVVSYAFVGTSEVGKAYGGTYTLSSGTDGSTDAIYTGDNGKYLFYGKSYSGTATWVCSATVTQGAEPTTDAFYIYADDPTNIAGAWSKSDSDYSGGISSVTRQETTTNSAANAASLASTSTSGTSEKDEYPDWPITISASSPYYGLNGLENSSPGAKWLQMAGTYVRTGDTFTSCGETIPIWSNGTCFIHAYQPQTGGADIAITEPQLGLFVPEIGNTYTPTYRQSDIVVPFFRKKSKVERPGETGGSVTCISADMSTWKWTIMYGNMPTIVETFSDLSSGGGWPPPGNCGEQNTSADCAQFWTDYYGCAIVTTGASRDWTDEQEDYELMQYPSLTCYPGGRYFVHVTAEQARTLNAGTYAGPPLAECEVVVKMDAGTSVTCGTSITMRGSFTAGQTNFCRLIWTGTSTATLIVQ